MKLFVSVVVNLCSLVEKEQYYKVAELLAWDFRCHFVSQVI